MWSKALERLVYHTSDLILIVVYVTAFNCFRKVQRETVWLEQVHIEVGSFCDDQTKSRASSEYLRLFMLDLMMILRC